MTVLSRALLRKLIINETVGPNISKSYNPKLRSGLTYSDDDTLDIDTNTQTPMASEFYDYVTDEDQQPEDLAFYDARSNQLGVDKTLYSDNPDYREMIDNLNNDFEEESDTEDTEGYPEFALFGPDDETEAQIRSRINKSADELTARIDTVDPRTAANARYAEIMKQLTKGEKLGTDVVDVGDIPPDPEFMDTNDIKTIAIREHIRRKVIQSVNRQLLLM
jgi:hypothetical protein|tara:strand:- start:7599 stop:8258 length:660 start_codon:yes stop_codon:yes gene_type:complete